MTPIKPSLESMIGSYIDHENFAKPQELYLVSSSLTQNVIVTKDDDGNIYMYNYIIDRHKKFHGGYVLNLINVRNGIDHLFAWFV